MSDTLTASTEMPPPDTVRQLLRYDAKTGALFWRHRCADLFKPGVGRYTAEIAALTWNKRYADMPALDCIDASLGYRKGSMLGKKVYAHRAIWAMQTGMWPSGDIDHIDGNRANNAWGNLRSVSRSVNAKNSCLRSNNTSGCMGVSWFPSLNKWRSSIWVNGKKISLGLYNSFDAAKAVRLRAEVEYGYHENHGRAS